MRIVKPLILLVFVFCFISVKAQDVHVSQDVTIDQNSSERLASLTDYKKVVLNDPYNVADDFSVTAAPGQRMRNVGRGLTIGGAVLLVGGVILMSTADEIYYTSNTYNGDTESEGDLKGAIGLVMAVGGVGMIVPGTIFWVKGAKRMKRGTARASLSMGMNKNGAGLRLSF